MTLKNRGTYFTAGLLILAGIGVAAGYTARTEMRAPGGGPVTYETVDEAVPVGDNNYGLGLIATLLGVLGIRQRLATGRVQRQLARLEALALRNADDGK